MNNLLHTVYPERPGRAIYVPPAGPPSVSPPNVYAAMGEENVFAMLADFYRELEVSSIRSMFPRDMLRASQKSAAFFVTLLGGPPLYQQRYGNPAMRARHMPFVIDEAAKQVWIGCFFRVLESASERYSFPAESLPQFRDFLEGFAGWMVNTATEGADEAV